MHEITTFLASFKDGSLYTLRCSSKLLRNAINKQQQTNMNKCFQHFFIVASRKGWLHVLKTIPSTFPNNKYAMDFAARNGHLHVVQWIHNNRREGCSKSAMDGASENGHLHIVQWLHANRKEGCTRCAMDGAARNGHLHVVQWLYTNRNEGCTKDAIDFAAAKGHNHVVQWLHANKHQ